MCVLWAPLLFEEKATFQTTTKTAAVQDLQSSYSCLTIITDNMQGGFQQLNIVFKSFWCKSCWTAWFSYPLITQCIFFSAARSESSHIWADSQDMGSTSRSLIFHGSWERHCPLWELSPRAQLSSFSHGGWHCKRKRILLGSINACTHICVLTGSPLFSVFLSGSVWGAEGVGSYLCWSPTCWCSVALFVLGGLSLTLSAPHAISSICTAE